MNSKAEARQWRIYGFIEGVLMMNPEMNQKELDAIVTSKFSGLSWHWDTMVVASYLNDKECMDEIKSSNQKAINKLNKTQ